MKKTNRSGTARTVPPSLQHDYPVRINRYLFLEKVCSRREADTLIEQGSVFINEITAVLGQKIEPKDVVSVQGLSSGAAKKYYVLLNKPIGVVSHNPGPQEKGAESFMRDIPASLSPVGRLDKASRGLMLFSNDGLIVDRMLNPKYDHEKEYLVTVDKRIDKHFLESMRAGVTIEGYKTKPATVSKVDPRVLRVVLTEGKKHQLRRMCAALGYQIIDLKRTRIGNLRLGNLRSGKYKILDGLALLKFKKSIGM